MNKHPILITALLCIFCWITFAASMPVVLDEAYYFVWSGIPALGFFDHPPFVSLMAYSNQLFPGSAFGSRLGTIVVAILTLLAVIRFFRIFGVRDKHSLWVAFLFCQFNLLGLIGGFLTTPDTALVLFWVLAVTESVLALNGQRWRWLTAGLFTGLGLWSKYTMLIIGAVFLWGLVRETMHGRKENGLLSAWPYAGGLVALLIFAPHLDWNAQNDWITFKFQLRHGLSLERPELAASNLPRAESAEPDGVEATLAENFEELLQAQETEELKPKPWDMFFKKLNIYLGFYGSQLAVWGFLAIPVLAALRRRKQNKKDHSARFKVFLTTGARHVVIASVAVPLLVFGFLSLFSKVEANWSAMYIVGASALIGRHLVAYVRNIKWYAAANVLIVLLLILHAHFGILPLRENRDRIMAETHGFRQLANIAAGLPGPVFSDSYQIASMLRFYESGLSVRQWPGITRDSEFLRNPKLADINYEKLSQIGSFWLITSQEIPPKIKGFKPVDMAQLRDCKDGSIQVIKAGMAHDYEARCKTLIHDWFLLNYTSL